MATSDVPVVDTIRSPARLRRPYVLLAVFGVVVLLPIYATLIGALKPGDKLLDYPRSLLPVDLTLNTFIGVASGQPGPPPQLLHRLHPDHDRPAHLLVLAARAFLDFPFKRAWFIVFIATLVPAESIVRQPRDHPEPALDRHLPGAGGAVPGVRSARS